MDSASQSRDGSSELVSHVLEGSLVPTVSRGFTDLLEWLAAPDSSQGASISQEFEKRGIDAASARSRAFELLEEVIFARPDRVPHRLLALEESAPEERVRERYRLLMRVYHPDLGAGSDEWLHERSARLNEAYRRMRDRGAAESGSSAPPATATARRRSGRPRSRRRQSQRLRIRRRFGSPRVIQRRVLLAVTALGAASVAYAFLANQTWHRWSEGPSREITTQQLAR